MMERVALSAGRCGSECVEYSTKFLLTIKLFIETYKVESYLGDLGVFNLYGVR